VRIANGATQQIIGREGETATFLSRRLFILELRVFGFAPRQLNRSIARGDYERCLITKRFIQLLIGMTAQEAVSLTLTANRIITKIIGTKVNLFGVKFTF